MAFFVIYDVNLSKKFWPLKRALQFTFVYSREVAITLCCSRCCCVRLIQNERIFFCLLEMILIPYVNVSINRPMSYREAIQMTKIKKPITQLPPSFFIRCKWLLTNLPFAIIYNLEFEAALFCPRWPRSKLVRPGLLLLSFV